MKKSGPIVYLLGGVVVCVVLGLLFGGMGSNDFFAIFMVLALVLHAISGFIGIGILIKKGWMFETFGCIILAGGAPILFPTTL